MLVNLLTTNVSVTAAVIVCLVAVTGFLLRLIWILAMRTVREHEGAIRSALTDLSVSTKASSEGLRSSIDKLADSLDDIAGTLHEKINATNDRLGKTEGRLATMEALCRQCQKLCSNRGGRGPSCSS